MPLAPNTIFRAVKVIEGNGTPNTQRNILNFASTFTVADDTVNKRTNVALDQSYNFTFTGNTSFTNPVVGVTPTLSTHLTTKAYVDGATKSIVWKTGTLWATILAEITTAGGAAIVLLDPGTATSGNVSFVLGPASADLSRVALVGLINGNSQPIIDVDSSFRLLGNPTLRLTDVSINVSAPLFSGALPLKLSLIRSGFQRNSGSVGPTFDLSSAGASSFVDIESYDWGYFLNQGDSSPIILLGSGGTGSLLIMGDNSLYSFAGGLINAPAIGTHAAVSIDADSSIDYHAGVFGAYCDVTFGWISLAKQVSYTPTTPTDWVTTPTLVSGALDELAQRSSFYSLLENNGTPLTARTTANFSTAFALTDNAGLTRTDITIATGGITNAMLQNSTIGLSGTSGQLSVAGSPISLGGSATVSLVATGVTPGSYGYGNGSITFDTYGRATAASSATNIVSRGVAVNDFQLTTTVPTSVMTYTPASQGTYLVVVYYIVKNAGTSLSMTLSWSDSVGAVTKQLINTATWPVGSYEIPLTTINAVSSAITVTATAGITNNVFISGSIIGV